ncbi:MAG: hypothetical protein ACLP29_11560 [Dissulfurispiraceae bacterium]
MDMMILVVGGIIIGLGLILKAITKKTGYDFNDKKYFKTPAKGASIGPEAVDINPNNSPYGLDS